MTTSDTPPIPVIPTREDRNAAADLAQSLGYYAYNVCPAIRDGQADDNRFVQAFAAHRQASTKELLETLEDCSRRLRYAMIVGGTDPEYADEGVAQYVALITRMKGGAE